MSGDGFWTSRGVAASVDWCEPNYAVTPYVAEFWNTVTSGFIALIAVYGMWRCLRSPTVREARFTWSFFGLAIVGAGSMAFHGTLLRFAQALDELPMVYVGLLGAWLLIYRQRESGSGRPLAWSFGAYGVLFTVAYLWVQEYFLLFIATYASLVAFLALRSIYLTWWQESPSSMRTLLRISSIGYLGTLFFCWVPEHVLLACDHPLQGLHLHAWWHVGAGIGTYSWFVWCIIDRERSLRGQALELKLLPLPFAERGPE